VSVYSMCQIVASNTPLAIPRFLSSKFRVCMICIKITYVLWDIRLSHSLCRRA